MTPAADRYDAYYADKLWNLLPEVYRTEDTATLGTAGPLRELVNRIGAQAAVLRRSIDRMWDDQSIETCDDWLIPYIGALLDVRPIDGLDGRGRRLDVARTIHYRRRKGTVAILEQIAGDITGWDVKVVEFYRRLGRTRHGLDPAIGTAADAPEVAALQRAEGLRGASTGTGIGGFADLRDAYGAAKAHSAFDEFFHTADVRRGRGRSGWYAIPRLGVFLWRLTSLAVGPVTPIAVRGCPGWFTFDPTGRDIPLFAPARTPDALGDAWVSPDEAALPTPISRMLLERDLAAAAPRLYPAAISAAWAWQSPPAIDVLPPAVVTIRPERGRFRVAGGSPPQAGSLVASYCYGFPSEIGAGPYDRRGAVLPIDAPDPVIVCAGGSTASVALPGTGTIVLADSLTYAGLDDVAVTDALTLCAGIRQRPLVRRDGGTWTITGQPGSRLTLDGLFLSGADVVLAGSFASVVLSCCTLDPGTAAGEATGAVSPPAPFATAADGRPLAPTRLWIEANVATLAADRCVLGPIRTRAGGVVETATITDTVVQAIDADAGGAATALAFAAGVVELSRCTIMGEIAVHRLEASETILQGLARVDDTQHGCVRFSAWAEGSLLPRRYESARIRPGAPLFTATAFGRPGYGQLLPLADQAILPAGGEPAHRISDGAENGAEMGAYARDKNPIKARALHLRFREYMPADLVPMLIEVT